MILGGNIKEEELVFYPIMVHLEDSPCRILAGNLYCSLLIGAQSICCRARHDITDTVHHRSSIVYSKSYCRGWELNGPVSCYSSVIQGFGLFFLQRTYDSGPLVITTLSLNQSIILSYIVSAPAIDPVSLVTSVSLQALFCLCVFTLSSAFVSLQPLLKLTVGQYAAWLVALYMSRTTGGGCGEERTVPKRSDKLLNSLML